MGSLLIEIPAWLAGSNHLLFNTAQIWRFTRGAQNLRLTKSRPWLPRRPGSDTVMKLILHSLWCILLSAVVVVVVRVVVVVGGVWLMRVKVEVDVDGLMIMLGDMILWEIICV